MTTKEPSLSLGKYVPRPYKTSRKAMDYIEQETRPWIEQQQDSATAPEVLTLPRLVVDVFMKGMVLTARDSLSQRRTKFCQIALSDKEIVSLRCLRFVMFCNQP